MVSKGGKERKKKRVWVGEERERIWCEMERERKHGGGGGFRTTPRGPRTLPRGSADTVMHYSRNVISCDLLWCHFGSIVRPVLDHYVLVSGRSVRVGDVMQEHDVTRGGRIRLIN